MKYESELVSKILESRGHEKPSIHYKSECIETWIAEEKGGYPKLCDYQSEWLNYINEKPEKPVGNFPYKTVIANPNATVDNVVPYEYKSVILKGCTGYRDIDTGEILETFEEGRNLELVSVRMPVLTTIGKNLFDVSAIPTDYPSDYVTPPTTHSGRLDRVSKLPVFKLKPNTTYTMSIKINKPTVHWIFTFVDSSHDSLITVNSASESVDVTKTFTTNNDGDVYFGGYLTLQYRLNEVIEALSNGQVQLEESQSATPYEPYKTNILSTNEDVTLRGIGDVKDTLDCLTGEVTERIKEILNVEKGEWKLSGQTSSGLRTRFYIQVSDLKVLSEVKSDKFNHIGRVSGTTDVEGIGCHVASKEIHLIINNDKLSSLDLDGLNEFFKNNNTLIQYQLETPTIKTVDLNVVDQNGKMLNKIKPFEGVMHFISDGTPVNPIAVLEIPVEAIAQNLASFIEE